MRCKRISPIMTSNVLPAPYVVACSSVYSATYEGWKAFNGTVLTADSSDAWVTANGTLTGWLSIDLGSAAIVNRYRIKTGNHANYVTGAPKNWTFEGSNDNNNWDILDTRENELYTAMLEEHQFDFDNSVEYRYYRINITANGGYASYTSIGDLSLWHVVSGDSNYYVSQQNGSDENDGLTPQTAWATISKATQTVGCSTSEETYVYVGPGTYREFVTLMSGGTNSNDKVIFAGDPNCLYLTDNNPGIVRITGCDINEVPSTTAKNLISFLTSYVELWDIWVDGGAYNQYLLYGTVQYGGNGQICRRVRANGYYGFGYLICYDCFGSGIAAYGYCECYDCIGIGAIHSSYGTFYGSRSFNCLAIAGYYGFYGGWSYNCISMYAVYGYYGGYSNNCSAFLAATAFNNTGTHLNAKYYQCGASTNTAPLLMNFDFDTVLRKAIADSGEALIPQTRVMTSNIAPAPYVASASSQYGTTYAPWKAFTQTNTSNTDCWISINGTNTGWLAYDMSRETRVNYYKVASRNFAGELSWPKDWTFEGSHNNVDWEIIDTQTDQVFGTPEEKTYYLPNPVKYRYFRINITANGGLPNYVAIGEFSFGETMSLALPKDISGNERVGGNGTVDLGPFETPDYTVDWEDYFEKPPALKLQGVGQIAFKFPVEAGRDVIKMARVKHVNTAADKKPQIVCRGLEMEFSSTAAADSDTWEQVSLTFTPTKTGVMEFILSTRDTESTSYSLFSDII